MYIANMPEENLNTCGSKELRLLRMSPLMFLARLFGVVENTMVLVLSQASIGKLAVA